MLASKDLDADRIDLDAATLDVSRNRLVGRVLVAEVANVIKERQQLGLATASLDGRVANSGSIRDGGRDVICAHIIFLVNEGYSMGVVGEVNNYFKNF